MKCFISHASEDKEAFVRPLAFELRRCGRKVWYDEFSLRPGNSLRRSIDKGLAECDVGIVVLSKAFFANEWPQRELDALLAAEIGGTKKLYPIWHEIDAATVARVSPMLADKFALQSSAGVDVIAGALASLIPPDYEVSGDLLATALELHLSRDAMVENFLLTSCRYRFFHLQSYFAECQRLMDAALCDVSDEEVSEAADVASITLGPKFADLARVHNLPTDVEIVVDEPLPDERIAAWIEAFEAWVSGTLGEEDTDTFS